MKNGELSTESPDLIQKGMSRCSLCRQMSSNFEQERQIIHEQMFESSRIASKKMSDEEVQLEMSDEFVNQLKDKLAAVKEYPSSVKDTASAALKEIMMEENSGSAHVSDEDSAKLVDFIVQSLRNHAIKSAGKNTFRFSPHLMGLAMNEFLEGPTAYGRFRETAAFVCRSPLC